MLVRGVAKNVTEVQKEMFPDVSTQVIRCHLKEAGLVCWVRKAKPFICPANKEKWRLWALAHESWTVEDWKNMIFSDESKFLLFKSNGHQWAWFQPGQAYENRFVKKTVKHGGGNIMVWGCISGRGMGRLQRVEGIMCTSDYVEILEGPLLGSLKDLRYRRTGNSGVLFQQDNDPKHKSQLAMGWLKMHCVKLLDWAPSSPNMSIIEYMWDQLDALIQAHIAQPITSQPGGDVGCTSGGMG